MTGDNEPARDQRLEEILLAYLEAVEAGQAPGREEFLASHPAFAAELAAFLDGRECIQRLAAPLQQLSTEPTTLPPTDTAPPDTPLQMVRSFGDYELLQEIARGGMGVIYKARQRSLDRVVALKMILAGALAGEADVQRFRQEAQTAARLQHPGIVPLHEVGEYKGQHYFSMDYIEGRSLADLVRDNPLPPKQAVRYVRLIAEAVHFAHGHGVLHRDLKPSNVLIDCFDQPRVTDFGLAKNLGKDAGLTDTGAVVGTPSYMPPEQASGARGKLSPASDTYALGAVLYELVTGRPPFRAATPLDTLLQVLNDEPASPRLLNPGISRDLETVILKCLHKDPARRYTSAHHLADDLGALLEGRPVQARRPSLPERVALWLKRQGRTFKVAAATAGAAAVALWVVYLILDWQHRDRLGWVQFETAGLALRAEVFTEDNTLAVPPFTAPTQQPLPLPEGDYRVRLSAENLLSETLPLLVQRGKREKCTSDLSKQRLGDPLPSWYRGVFEFVPRGKGHDVLTAVDQDTLSRYDAATGKLRWTVTLGPDDQPVDPGRAGADQPRVGMNRSRFFWQDPRLLQPCHDLDGDGTPDLVWVGSGDASPGVFRATGFELLALSGKDGKVLWQFRSAGAIQTPTGPAVWFNAPGKDNQLLIFVLSANEAVALDARTGQSVWRFGFDNNWFPRFYSGSRKPRGPWVLNVDGRPVLVCVAGSRLVGLEPSTGKPAWEPVDLGFVPVGTPAFADLDGDGRIDMVLRGPEDRTVRAVTVPAGKVLWPREHTLPVGPYKGWVPYDLGSGFLLDPLPIDLDGDGKAEVIVPDTLGAIDVAVLARGRQRSLGAGNTNASVTIAVLDGPSGRLRWRSTVAINQGSPGAARVLVGPDLDGDGCRDLYVANVIGNPSDVRLAGLIPGGDSSSAGWNFHPFMRVQALSGKTGEALWRCHFPISIRSSVPYFSEAEEPLIFWHGGGDGWPMLVVPGYPHSLVVEGGTGQVAHAIPGVPGPYRAIDLDGDGIPELIGFQPPRDDVGGSVPGRLHFFRGTDPKAGNPRPIRPQQEEPVDWVPLPWVEIMTPETQPETGATFLLAGDAATRTHNTLARGLQRILLVPALMFLAYVGLCVLRKGWGGLWVPGSGFVVSLLVLMVFFLVRTPGTYEPWKRYSWDGWYWILYFALAVAAIVAALWELGIFCLRLFRPVFRRRASAGTSPLRP
jgi:outer membrane protein assembly factor BamB/tRNA A-37 threonylcarbamoyl transferase component Bud32